MDVDDIPSQTDGVNKMDVEEVVEVNPDEIHPSGEVKADEIQTMEAKTEEVNPGEGDGAEVKADDEVNGDGINPADIHDDWEEEVALFISEHAPEVRRRILALKKVQLDVTKLDAAFHAELHAIEEKYAPIYNPIFEKRRQITTGEYEPSDPECAFPKNDDEEIAVQMGKINLDEDKGNDSGVIKGTGIPDFWLKIFSNVELLKEVTAEVDVAVLKHLIDVTAELSNDPMGFKLYFHFSPNEYFKNTVLTKSYVIKCEVDEEDPFSFEGPEIVDTTGCSIDWCPGKNVTLKEVESDGILIEIPEAHSFFNLFNPVEAAGEGEKLHEDVQPRIPKDFEIGRCFRERIIPRAVLFYTREALEEDEEHGPVEEVDDEDNLGVVIIKM